MRRKIFGMILAVVLAGGAWAHDGGHGPKLADPPKYGGVLAPVVDLTEAASGAKAAVVYKAELVRDGKGQVYVYILDKAMKPISLKTFDEKATAIMGSGRQGKKKDEFGLVREKDSFVGKMPAPRSKRYKIEVRFKEGKRELLAAFNNLD